MLAGEIIFYLHLTQFTEKCSHQTSHSSERYKWALLSLSLSWLFLCDCISRVWCERLLSSGLLAQVIDEQGTSDLASSWLNRERASLQVEREKAKEKKIKTLVLQVTTPKEKCVTWISLLALLCFSLSFVRIATRLTLLLPSLFSSLSLYPASSCELQREIDRLNQQLTESEHELKEERDIMKKQLLQDVADLVIVLDDQDRTVSDLSRSIKQQHKQIEVSEKTLVTLL